MKILFLEPFYGGSHRDFAEGLINHSRHHYDLHTLPQRFWKWRMRGAALYFSHRIKDPGKYDLLLTSDLMSLSDLKSLWAQTCPSAVVYFHESQLSYPLPPGEKMDYQFGFTDITTALTADGILFNSYSHLKDFFDSLPGFIRMMPEYRPTWVINILKAKSRVLYPGCQISPDFAADKKTGNSKPLIIWNHRWEFDKNPESFFRVLGRIDDQGIPFNLALLGENFQTVPQEFIQAKQRYGKRILHYGRVKSKQEYLRVVARGDIVISTSLQENFGISVIEAIRLGCFPLLPNRLSYPELLPGEYHGCSLYDDDEQLYQKLKNLLTAGIPDTGALSQSFAEFSWETAAESFDRYFEEIAQKREKC